MGLPRVIDCGYIHPKFAAAYLIREGQEAAFVETNTSHSIPKLLDALKEEGLDPEQVRYIMVTHVHLDHAGGASALMEACPNARLLAHPKAAPHLIDPTRLVESAKKVYGEEEFKNLYGEIGPIPPQRVQSCGDRETVLLGDRVFEFLHTRGHANHHFCIFDHKSNGVFTGDTFGLAYPALQEEGLFILPSTSPTDFEPEEAKKSIQKILMTGATRAYLTHFGIIEDLSRAEALLKSHLNLSEGLLQRIIEKGETQSREESISFCYRELQSYFSKVWEGQSSRPPEGMLGLLDLDLRLNAAGIVHSALKKTRS